jgi:hypothetical protein
VQDRTAALLSIANALTRIPGVTESVAYARALDAIHQDSGLPVEHLRLALPALTGALASLNATQLAARLGMPATNASAAKVNKALAELGLQERNPRKEWVPTEAGAEYAEARDFARTVRQGSKHEGVQTRWKETVLTPLRAHLGLK